MSYFNSGSPRYEISLSQGDFFTLDIYALYNNGMAYDLTNFTGIANIRSSYAATGIAGSFDVNIIDPTGGYINLSMQPSGTASLPSSLLFYDVQLSSGNYQTKYIAGRVTVYPSLSSNF